MRALTLALLCLTPAVTAAQDADTDRFVQANVLAIFYHELGHAVIDLQQVPIFGQEEDAADVFSIFLIDALFEPDSAEALAYDTALGFLGEAVLGFVGISMPAFRIAGGILLFLTALDMLFERRTKRREDKADEDETPPDPSVFPIAIPLIAGPGAIASMILLTGRAEGPAEVIGVMAVMGAVLLIVLVLFLLASRIEQMLGRTGIIVVTRLLGMLLAALSVQFVLDGLRDFGIAAG